jgi:hypothetical protein
MMLLVVVVVAIGLSSAAVDMPSINQASAKVCISDSSNDNNRKSNNNYDHHTVTCTPHQYPITGLIPLKIKRPSF